MACVTEHLVALSPLNRIDALQQTAISLGLGFVGFKGFIGYRRLGFIGFRER